ncbi:DNA-directed RNA polymerase III subunit RPC6-like protein [Tanacetum coccineum]
MISMMLCLVFPPWRGVTNWATHLVWDGCERIRKFRCKRSEDGGRLSIEEGNENHDDRRDSLKRCMVWHVGQVYKVSGDEGSIDTQRCEVTYTLAVFAKMFKKARDENEQIAEAEKKKLEKEAQKEHSSANKKEGVDVDSKKDLRNMIRDTSLSIKKRDAFLMQRMSLLNKRKKPEPKSATGGLPESDKKVLDIIKSKKESAIWVRDLKRDSNLADPIVAKSLKNLLGLGLIKEVKHVQFKLRKHYIAAEFEPSQELTGGSWYVDGNLDTAFIEQLKDLCLKVIRKLKVATAGGVHDFFKANRLTNTDCTSQQISEILKSMVFDNMIIDVKSTGLEEYHKIPVGQECYRCIPGDNKPITGAMVTIPCGVCPRIRQCTPDGLISPSTCVYFNKWLEF